MDDPTAMPEGTVPSLVVDDEGDSLDERERATLHDAVERTRATAQTPPGRDARNMIADLRAMLEPVAVAPETEAQGRAIDAW